MGKLQLFTIVITNSQGVCQAADAVTGYVLVILHADMKMRGIQISFKGNAHVKFTERRSKSDRTYKATEDYFDEQHVLFKPAEGTDYLPKGEHRFDFRYHLPPNLPSTFEGEYGYVRYYVKCRIDKPLKFDHTVKEAFTVLSILDLNTEPCVEEPVHLQDQSNSYSCCCVKDGEAKLTLDLPRTGFVPGEGIPITAELSTSVPETLSFTAELKQYISYRAKGHSKDRNAIVSNLDAVSMTEGKTFNYNRQMLHIPAIPPSRLVGCGIIDIQYVLKLKATTGWFAVTTKAPITIGTVPLRSVVDMFRAPPMPDINAIALEPSAPALVPPESYPRPQPSSADFEMPPPSYADCVFGSTNIRDDGDDQHTMGAANYAPKYTYYNWT